MSKKIDRELNRFYRDKRLSPSQLEELNELQTSIWSFNIKSVALVVVPVCLIAVLTYLFFKPTRMQSIVAEVAYNHLKDMPSEVLSSDIGGINEALDRLDFVVRIGSGLTKSYEVVGARYCSVRGELAAQVKLRNLKTGQEDTLYVYPANVAQLPVFDQAHSENNRGVQVKVWRENELGFALATFIGTD